MLLYSFEDYLMYKASFMWILVSIILFIVSLLFLISIKGAETNVKKKLSLGYFSFFFCYGLTRIFFFIGDYFGEYQPYDDSVEFIFFMKAAYIAGSIGLFALLFVYEQELIPTKYILSIVNIICIALFIILPYVLMQPIAYIFQVLVLVEILSVYIYIGVKGVGDIKKLAIKTILSLIIFFLGVFLDSRMISDLNIIPPLIPPILVIIGVILIYYFQKPRKD